MSSRVANLKILVLLFVSLFAFACGGSDKSRSFSLGHKGGHDLNSCLALVKKKKSEDAVKCLEAYKSRNYGQEGAADADLAIADAYFTDKDWLVAAEAYNLFIETYPYHEKMGYAYYRSGVSYMKASPKSVERDQSYLEHASKSLGAVLDYYPNTPYASPAKAQYDLARYKLAKKQYIIGRFYFRNKQYLSSIPRFQTVITDYSQTRLSAPSFYYIVKAYRETEQTELAQRYFELYKRHNPDDMKTIKKMAALF
jgi:outer membrane protein assembly factor BamD